MNNSKQKNMLSEHFSLDELTYSRIAMEKGLDNTPYPEARLSLQRLVTCLLEPLRQLYKGPIVILSGYRSTPVNRLAGGVPTSQHRKGEAADCYIPEGPGYLLTLLLKSGLSFDQAILYKGKRFLHLSYKADGKNRLQVILSLVWIISLCAGCGTREKCTGEYRHFNADSIVWSSRDNLHRTDYSYITDSFLWERKEVAYLPPDSTGKQFVAKVTIAKAFGGSSQRDTLLVVATHKEDLKCENQEETAVRITRQPASPALLLRAGGLLLIVLLCIWAVRRRLHYPNG